ncbi:MAG: hypothetical protein FJX36_14590 [Alphaproteobacteria bacterium]|nr:hypothetical protein [Alphaproteobacteria bacterium]
MSSLTNLNRWYRYQVTRVDGLVSGLKAEARTVGRVDLEDQVNEPGDALRLEMQRQMMDRRECLRLNDRLEVPEIRFDRL